MPVGFFKMTTGPFTWGYTTAPLAPCRRPRDGVPARPRAGRRQLDQRHGLHPRQRRRTTTPGPRRRAAPAGPTATCCPTSAGPRTMSASRTQYHGTRRPARRLRPDQPAPPLARLRPRRPGGRPPLQPRLQRRPPGGLRPLPGDPARRPALLAPPSAISAPPCSARTSPCSPTAPPPASWSSAAGPWASPMSAHGREETARAETRGDRGRGRDRLAQAPAALRHRPGGRAAARSASSPSTTCRASAATCRTISTSTRSTSSTARTATTSTPARTGCCGPGCSTCSSAPGP